MYRCELKIYFRLRLIVMNMNFDMLHNYLIINNNTVLLCYAIVEYRGSYRSNEPIFHCFPSKFLVYKYRTDRKLTLCGGNIPRRERSRILLPEIFESLGERKFLKVS